MKRGQMLISTDLFSALASAAMETPCVCAAPENRRHDGLCVSCWALNNRLERLEALASVRDPAHLQSQIVAMRTEQKLRAEQLPVAEARVRAARDEEVELAE